MLLQFRTYRPIDRKALKIGESCQQMLCHEPHFVRYSPKSYLPMLGRIACAGNLDASLR
jgi:hypothetical protein